MELRHLRHLLAVAEHGNFSRAADAVHLTQPALSRSIQALEAEVGATLLERTRGAIEPTEIGRVLLRHAQALHAAVRDIEREIRLTKGLELGELRVGVGPFGGAALVGPVVGRLNREHPRLRVGLVVAPWQELPERARSREVDLLVAELSEVQALEDFEIAPLTLHRTCGVCRPGHPLQARPDPSGSGAEAAAQAVTAREFLAYPLAGPRLPQHAAQRLAAALPAAARKALRVEAMFSVECDSSSILKSVVRESDAVSLMPRFMVASELAAGQLVELPGLDLGITARFGAAWLRQRSMSLAGRRFIELLRAHDAALAGDAPGNEPHSPRRKARARQAARR